MEQSVRELVRAAEDLAQAQCTRHRNRARLRVLRAIEDVDGAVSDRPSRERLLVDLAEYVDAAGQDGDPCGLELAERCFNQGVLVREERRRPEP